MHKIWENRLGALQVSRPGENDPLLREGGWGAGGELLARLPRPKHY